MNFIEAAILILGITILCVPIANRLRIPLEIFLFLGSCLISLTPGLPIVKLNPVIVFDLFLPPILFYAAYFTAWQDFKFNLRPIVLLAIGLVIFTMVMVALVVKWVFPGFSWAEAFLLGAIVSPTDASAATAIIKKLGAPRRIITVLEGESLINDASALMLYKFSLAAVLYGTFSLTDAASRFCMITLGGIIIGGIIALVAIFILKRLKDTRAETSFTFITAFASYLVAEHLGSSGVIATVVAGLYFGIKIPEIASSHTKVQAKATWDIFLFIINGFVFTLIGFQLPQVVKNLTEYSIYQLVFYGGLISAVVILVRLAWVYPAAYIPRIVLPSIAKRDPMPSWQMLFAIGWSGMRGIVSLAAVLALPVRDSQPLFDHVDLLIFVTYIVIVVTLIVPTVTLPFFVRKLRLEETRDIVKEEATARVRAIEEVRKSLVEIKGKNIPEDILKEFISQTERRYQVVQTQLDENPYSMLSEEYLALKRLTLKSIKAEREALIKLRKSGEIHDEIFRTLSDELDLEELRARSLRI